VPLHVEDVGHGPVEHGPVHHVGVGDERVHH
jgi:hypothetical protein